MLNDLIALFYPNLCVCCQRALHKGEQLCCIFCLSELPRTNYYKSPDNPVAKLFWGRIELTYGFSTFQFVKEGKIQQLMHQLKYKGQTDIGIFMGREIGKEIKRMVPLPAIDLIVPVPLHPKREKIRGYNQSYYIAKGISEIVERPLSTHTLTRNTHTSSQTKKGKFERWENVSGIFKTDHPERIEGKQILLVDDVITTGATLESCAEALLAFGAKKVGIAVVASGF